MAALMLVSCNENNNEQETDISERLRNMKSSSVIPVVRENRDKQLDDGYEPLNYEVQKGIWLSYIDLSAMLYEADEAEFCESFDKACKNISALGLNTVYVHLRPFGDALYESSLYPTSAYLYGDFDPLEIICDTAHSYELSVHGWINPLRLQTAGELSQISDSYKTAYWYQSDSDKVRAVENDDHLWLNPAYPEVRELIAQGAAEIAAGYEIDGIHYDDYFYPTTDEYFDRQCFAATSQGQDLDSWRLSNISSMCTEIYSAVKAVDKDISVGISPQGNVDNNYSYMYADVEKWCSQTGYCDYILPQIYYGYNNSIMPFAKTLSRWKSMNTCKDVKLVIGLAAYKIGEEDEFTYNIGIVAQQLSDVLADDDCAGVAVYTYSSLFDPDTELADRISQENALIKAALADEQSEM